MKKNLKRLGLYSAMVSLLTLSLGFTEVKDSEKNVDAQPQIISVVEPLKILELKKAAKPVIQDPATLIMAVNKPKEKEVKEEKVESKPIDTEELRGDSLPYYTVSSVFLNVRSEANAQSKIVDTLVKDWIVEITDKDTNGWYPIKTGGFVNGKYIQPIEPAKVNELLEAQSKKVKPKPVFAQPVVAKPVVKQTVAPSTRSNNNTNRNETHTSSRFSSYELDLLARLVRAEAGAEPYSGKVAVAIVVLNRVASEKFPNTIHDVIYQRGQFSPVSNGMINKPATDETRRAVSEAISSGNTLGGALFFYDPVHAQSRWLDSLPTVTTIGGHVFKK